MDNKCVHHFLHDLFVSSVPLLLSITSTVTDDRSAWQKILLLPKSGSKLRQAVEDVTRIICAPCTTAFWALRPMQEKKICSPQMNLMKRTLTGRLQGGGRAGAGKKPGVSRSPPPAVSVGVVGGAGSIRDAEEAIEGAVVRGVAAAALQNGTSTYDFA